MLSIVYSSRAAVTFGESELADLLAQSRANNDRLGLTGMLLFRAGRFLQVLEGPADVLRERMAIIASDPRHRSIAILLEESIDERLFPSWTMGFEALSDETVAGLPGYRESFADVESGRDTSATLPALRELIRWFQVRTA